MNFQNGGDGKCVPSNTCSPCYVFVLGSCHQSTGCMYGQPTADAGHDQTATIGQTVTVDSAASTSPVAGIGVYTWAWSSRPAGSGALLQTTAGSTASFSPDVSGDYVVSLIVTSYTGCSSPASTVTIHVAAVTMAVALSVRVTWDGSLVTLKTINTQAGSFFAPFTGAPFPSPYLPQPGPPPFVDTNLIYIGGTYEAPPLSSGDLFGILFKANAPGLATFTIPNEPPPMSSHSYYQSLDNSSHNWTYHQGVTVRILP